MDGNSSIRTIPNAILAAEVLEREVRGALVDARDAALQGIADGSGPVLPEMRRARSLLTVPNALRALLARTGQTATASLTRLELQTHASRATKRQ